MLCITYWELSEDADFSKIGDIAAELNQKGIYPPKGINVIGQYMTAGNWGVTIYEAENEKAVYDEVNVWRVAFGPGFFKFLKQSVLFTTTDAVTWGFELR
jgi:hypothetical protein